ncbi:kinase domain protein [Opisthorchis viverrini]|uniref:non-specific serine/threonine protein kinase n=1 Tax=Opisthorchis viverrini TaxID=6198 RepID=A0A1S8XAD7_OPIVI|nr:kinase domain protein [Opisthorchis viverrini]
MFRPKRTKVTNDYKITGSVLGTGVSGKVLKCVQLRTGTTYALKILEDSFASRREVELHWRASACPNVVRVVDVYENNNEHTSKKYLLMVMECMEGGELYSRIKSRSSFTESGKHSIFRSSLRFLSPPYTEAARIVHQIASAIHHLHTKSIAHRDLKASISITTMPENLLFASKDPNSPLKLTDFGFAREVTMANSLKTPCYTPYYVAPEILNRVNYDKSCDLWSLGVITYIFKNGAPISPCMQRNIIYGNYDFPASHWAHVSNEAKDLISRLLLTEPERRLSSAQVMQHPWVAKYTSVPDTPLTTTQFLSTTVWEHVNDAMTKELRTMRLDVENVPHLLPVEQAKNPLLTKRKLKQDVDRNK